MQTEHNHHEKNKLSRNDFLKMTTLSIVPGLVYANGVFAINGEFSDPEDPLKDHVAIARALTHKPPKTFNNAEIPQGPAYYQLRTHAIALIADRVNKGEKFKKGEFKKLVTENLQSKPLPLNLNY